MVREANIKQATAEKQLKEAQGKVSFGCLIFKVKLLMNIWAGIQRVSYACYILGYIFRKDLSPKMARLLFELVRLKNCVSGIKCESSFK